MKDATPLQFIENKTGLKVVRKEYSEAGKMTPTKLVCSYPVRLTVPSAVLCLGPACLLCRTATRWGSGGLVGL